MMKNIWILLLIIGGISLIISTDKYPYHMWPGIIFLMLAQILSIIFQIEKKYEALERRVDRKLFKNKLP